MCQRERAVCANPHLHVIEEEEERGRGMDLALPGSHASSYNFQTKTHIDAKILDFALKALEHARNTHTEAKILAAG